MPAQKARRHRIASRARAWLAAPARWASETPTRRTCFSLLPDALPCKAAGACIRNIPCVCSCCVCARECRVEERQARDEGRVGTSTDTRTLGTANDVQQNFSCRTRIQTTRAGHIRAWRWYRVRGHGPWRARPLRKTVEGGGQKAAGISLDS